MIDTNIVLDLFLFQDASQLLLHEALCERRLVWVATPAMQQELAYVLERESTQQQARKKGVATREVMQAMVNKVSWVAPAPVCTVRCKDRTDQGFVDLAFFHGTNESGLVPQSPPWREPVGAPLTSATTTFGPI